MRIDRLFWILLACLMVAGCASVEDRPNVVVLVLDTVRRDHLSCYGYERPTSPHLEALAREAVVYEQAISAAPWTLPSHASLFTGLLPSRHGAHHEHPRLEGPHPTLAEQLGAAGYETAGFCNNPWVTASTGLTRGFESYEEPWRSRVSQGTFAINIAVDPQVHGMRDAGAAITFSRIRDWLDQRGQREERRPFFLFVNLIEAHSLYDPPEEFRERFHGQTTSRADVLKANEAYQRRAYADSLTAEEVAFMIDLYDAEIAYLDAWVDRLVAELRTRGLLDETLLVITSDHGEAFGDHRLDDMPLIDHQLSVYEELLSVPLIVRYPAARSAGLRVDAPVSSCDLYPTVLAAAGIEATGDLDGRVLPPEGPQQADRQLVSEYYRPFLVLHALHGQLQNEQRLERLVNRRLVAVRENGQDVILCSRGTVLRFDAADDPQQERPLPVVAGDPLVDRARAQLASMETDHGLAPAELEPAVREALRSLGYIH